MEQGLATNYGADRRWGELVCLIDKIKSCFQSSYDQPIDEMFVTEENSLGEIDLKLSMAKREPYWLGTGRGEPYGFGIGKREPYGFGIGKREVFRFLKSKIGKREPNNFGIGR